MKPARFDYLRPHTLDEALGHLASHDGEARILAGGQSLVPMLNLRLATPSVLVDINRLPGLDVLAEEERGLRVGALVRHADLAAHVRNSGRHPLLAAALPFVAHQGVRNRGTVCGSLALADPASELPACAVCLDAEIGIAAAAGRRVVPAASFFQGLYETALEPAEMIVDVVFPRADPTWHFRFEEVARRRGDFAIAGLASAFRISAGLVAEARLVFLALGDRPARSVGLEGRLIGAAAADAPRAFDSLREGDLAVEITDSGDYTAAYKRHLAAVLVRRALSSLEGRGPT